MSTSFSVLFTKSSNKKRKNYSDGILKLTEPSGGATTWAVALYSDGGDAIFRRQEKIIKIPIIGEEIVICGHDIQIEAISGDNSNDLKLDHSKSSGAEIRPVSSQVKFSKFSTLHTSKSNHSSKLAHSESLSLDDDDTSMTSSVPAQRAILHEKLSSQTTNILYRPLARTTIPTAVKSISTVRIPRLADVDKALYRLLKPHQIAAVDFVLDCLEGKNVTTSFSEIMQNHHQNRLRVTSTSTSVMDVFDNDPYSDTLDVAHGSGSGSGSATSSSSRSYRNKIISDDWDDNHVDDDNDAFETLPVAAKRKCTSVGSVVTAVGAHTSSVPLFTGCILADEVISVQYLIVICVYLFVCMLVFVFMLKFMCTISYHIISMLGVLYVQFLVFSRVVVIIVVVFTVRWDWGKHCQPLLYCGHW